MDRRLPRDEDGLAPDRRLTMAVGTRRTGIGRRGDRPSRSDRGPVERRVFVHATPRDGLGDAPRSGRDDGALPGAPSRAGRAALAGRRDDPLRAGTARPAARGRPRREPRGAARLALPAAGHRVGLRQRVELAARAGRRRDAGHPRRHVRAVRSLDGHPRPARPGVAGEPGRGAPARRSRSGPRRPSVRRTRPRDGRSGADRANRRSPGPSRSRACAGTRRRWSAGLILLVAIGFLAPRPDAATDPAVAGRAVRGRILELLPPAATRPMPDVRIVVARWRAQGPDASTAHLQGPSGRGGRCRATRSATRWS